MRPTRRPWRWLGTAGLRRRAGKPDPLDAQRALAICVDLADLAAGAGDAGDAAAIDVRLLH
jgi:hypothetical protein